MITEIPFITELTVISFRIKSVYSDISLIFDIFGSFIEKALFEKHNMRVMQDERYYEQLQKAQLTKKLSKR